MNMWAGTAGNWPWLASTAGHCIAHNVQGAAIATANFSGVLGYTVGGGWNNDDGVRYWVCSPGRPISDPSYCGPGVDYALFTIQPSQITSMMMWQAPGPM
jgi:hypothetical protein